MAWFKRKDEKFKDSTKKEIPDGLWLKCPTCSEILYRPELDKADSVCRHCNHHFRIHPHQFVKLVLDAGSEKELFKTIQSTDPLNFNAGKRYSEQLSAALKKTGDNEAIRCYMGKINRRNVILGVMNFSFIGGSMGSALGEKVSRSIEIAGRKECPLIIICASGGARMQEGALSLMQLAKTSARLAKYSEEGGLFISILTDPTTGGVTASFGMLGDIILAEPGALIGFAGPRVIKQTIGQDLPEGFQRSEFLLEKGFIDHIVSRNELKSMLGNIIGKLS
jgi:acetyl-CoA carboxylase carboxyl transferase subunit beta